MQGTVTLEKRYEAPVSHVWQALTDKEEMKKWYFDLKEFRAEVGFEFSFTAGDDKQQWLHLCRVTEVIPGKKLTYSWVYDGYAGESFVTFELFAEGKTTRLKLTHSGLHTFPADVQALRQENFEKGWSSILGVALPEYLAKNP